MNAIPERVQDISGKHFGRLTVVGFSHMHPERGSFWICECECGNKKVIAKNKLNAGQTSCGCRLKELRKKHALRIFGKYKDKGETK